MEGHFSIVILLLLLLRRLLVSRLPPIPGGCFAVSERESCVLSIVSKADQSCRFLRPRPRASDIGTLYIPVQGRRVPCAVAWAVGYSSLCAAWYPSMVLGQQIAVHSTCHVKFSSARVPVLWCYTYTTARACVTGLDRCFTSRT